MSTAPAPTPPLSVPIRPIAPRRLEEPERSTFALISDSLIPQTDSSPAASSEPDFWDKVDVALNARADAFEIVTALLGDFANVPPDDMLDELEALAADNQAAFQAISTVVAGAWLLTQGTRDRIGYHGQQSDRAGLEEAADEIISGILDPVLEQYDSECTRWVR